MDEFAPQLSGAAADFSAMASLGVEPRVIKDVHVACRRPCLLRAVVEANVDALPKASCPPEAQRLSPELRPTSQSPTLDSRTLTLDMPARLGAGLHKGGFSVEHKASPQSKSERLRSLHALGIPAMNDDELVQRKARVTSAQEPMRRCTKSDNLLGLPVSARGADIGLVTSRRCQGFSGVQQSVAELSPQAKFNLGSIDIDQHFQRRHCSAPPAPRHCDFKDNFEHSLRAEDYASVLGRPGGVGRRVPGRSRSKSPAVAAEGAASRHEEDVFPGKVAHAVGKFQECAAPPHQQILSTPAKTGKADTSIKGAPGRFMNRMLRTSGSERSITSTTTVATTADVSGSKPGSRRNSLNLNHNDVQQPTRAAAKLSRQQREELWKAQRRSAWV